MSWKSKNWSSLIVTGSTGVFAIISLISVYITVNTWITQREAARPYFTFKESPIIELSNQVKFEFVFRNVGTHPAIELTSKTLVFDQGLREEPLLIDEYSVVNDIPRDTVTSLLINMDPMEINPGLPNIRPYYIVISLRYTDPILKDSYYQTIYIKWAGVIEGKPQPLIHAEVSEKQAILGYLEDHQLLKEP